MVVSLPKTEPDTTILCVLEYNFISLTYQKFSFDIFSLIKTLNIVCNIKISICIVFTYK